MCSRTLGDRHCSVGTSRKRPKLASLLRSKYPWERCPVFLKNRDFSNKRFVIMCFFFKKNQKFRRGTVTIYIVRENSFKVRFNLRKFKQFRYMLSQHFFWYMLSPKVRNFFLLINVLFAFFASNIGLKN